MCIQTLEASSHPGKDRWRARNRFFEFDSPSKYNVMQNTTNNTHSPLSPNHVSRSTQWRMWLVAAWSIHFLVTISITVYGTMSNHGERKYIPVDVERVVNGENCIKAFVDVFAESLDAPGALVCCSSTSLLQQDGASALCSSPSSYLLFARRLAKFPEAWLLPLFPVLLRGAWHALQMFLMFLRPVGTSNSLEQSTGSNNNHHKNIENDPTVLRRVVLYLSIILARISILYVALNSLEERIANNAATDCWYQSMLPTSESSTCPGRMFDFSDHIVLYFAQILPIALFEVLHSFVVPYWNPSIRTNLVVGGERIGKKNRLIPALLLVGIVHLYIITLLGVYKTSTFFHTGPEILVGYMISLLVQIPLSLLQCTNLWPQVRTFFFGPSATNC